ncbi:MAG: acylphosphatase [Anaerolineaceae bacterium]|nr:acylphosphatase [Anaerolineaceae bacterium]
MENPNEVRLHAEVEGRVQGVGFRYFVANRAEALGIKGWVRNTFKGSVEVTAEASREQLENLLQDLRTGPPAAWVRQVEVNWMDAAGEFTTFSVKRSV